MSASGVIFNIQRFSVHDGPGIRTTVFLKGCSLRCFWCHNPEGLQSKPEIMIFPDRCLGDGECVRVCPHGAHEFVNGRHIYHRDRCDVCGRCVEVCYAGSLEMTGQRMTVDEVVAQVVRDRAFYETSGGGVTLSGGDPVLQAAFSYSVLARCRELTIHTAIETAGHCRWDDLASLLPVTDLVMMDLKQMDPVRHKEATGVGNERILANARRLAGTGLPLIFRVPIIPGVNDTPADIGAIARFVRELADMGARGPEVQPARAANAGAAESAHTPDGPWLELLPFHRLAGGKYQALDLDYRAANLDRPPLATMEQLTAAAVQFGIATRCR